MPICVCLLWIQCSMWKIKGFIGPIFVEDYQPRFMIVKDKLLKNP
uniref:Uncharacterized protein n=1 Tax=Rhizophora mucronata TaxID=61149 RepID=A0A2P2P509_RHIMU